MMEWIDLTHEIDEHTLTYPGDPKFIRQVKANHLQNGFHIEEITTAMHVGTHLDSPFHFISNGITIEELDINKLIGKAYVVHLLPDKNIISTQRIKEQLVGVKNNTSILLIDTGNDVHFNTPRYFDVIPEFEPSVIELLEEYHIQVLGLDLPTISFPNRYIKEAHLAVLSRGIVLIEGLNNLSKCKDLIDFIGLPLKIKGMDGSMIRAVGKNL